MSGDIDLGVGQWLILKLTGGMLQVVYRAEGLTRYALTDGLVMALEYLKGWGVEV